MNKKGFTLIELLSVLVVLGIVVTIAIQSYGVLIKDNDESKYTYYLDLMKYGADLYLENKKDGMIDGGCLSVNYQTLVDKNLVKEEDVECEGKLLLIRNKRKYTYDDSLLKCKTKSGHKVLKDVTTTEHTTCIAVD